MATRTKKYVSDNPLLMGEWDYRRNLDLGLTAVTTTTGSNKRAWWRCSKGHEWCSTVNNRSQGRGCPYCASKKVCAETCLATISPTVALELHQTKNGALTAETVAAYSNRRIWWQCGQGHEWRAVVSSRTNGSGCPYCSGYTPSSTNNIGITHPHLVDEWDSKKNGVPASSVSKGSCRLAWWSCARGHSWRVAVYNRVRGNGCPYCAGQVITEHNCLAYTHPALALEWDEKKNISTPKQVMRGSTQKAWWRCTSGHSWCATINSRSAGAGCPKCSGGSISKMSQQWLDSLGIPEEFREYPIKLPGRKRAIKVDGFDPKTNTVYEFLGDFWHGNPDLYDSEEVNPSSKKTFGALLNQTTRRLQQLRKAGYTVVFVWEKDFKELECTSSGHRISPRSF